MVAVLHTPTTPVALDPYLEAEADSWGPDARLVSRRLPTGLEETVAQVEDFLREHSPTVVVYHGTSRVALALAPLLAREGIPHILTTSTSTQLVGITPYTHRLVPSDTVQGRVLASFAVDRLGVRRPAVLYLRDDYGASITKGLAGELRSRGVDDIFLLPHDPRSDFELLVEGVARLQRPDGVFLAGYGGQVGRVVPLLKEWLPGVPIIGTDAIVSPAGPDAPEGWREELEGLYMATFWLPSPEGDPREREIIARYRALGGKRPSHFVFLLQDGIDVARAAVQRFPRRRAVERYLEELGRQRPALAGLTGPLHFGPGRTGLVRIARLGAADVEPVEGPP